MAAARARILRAALTRRVPFTQPRLRCADFHWVGFYRAVGARELVIGPYQGGHGCLRIAFSRGVCGAAARSRQTQLVPDVHACPGHIACASSTRSELVVPLVRPTADGRGALLGVLDVDSDEAAAFSAVDAVCLEALAANLAALEWRTGVDAATE